MMRSRISVALAFLGSLVVASSAQAHTGHGAHGFDAGATHPLTGVDHLLAMIAVGIWATRTDADARRWWFLPAVFVSGLLAGLALGIVGMPFPGVEIGIKGSVVALGLLLAGGWKLPTPYAVAITVLFAVCHGHAHGEEMPADASGFAYGIGMVLTTAALHVCGVGIGWLARQDRYLPALRVGGGAIAAVGVLLLVGVI